MLTTNYKITSMLRNIEAQDIYDIDSTQKRFVICNL